MPAITHAFLLAGQSNMAGRGVVEACDTVPHPRVFALDARCQWCAAMEPIHFDRPEGAGVGPGLAFGRAVAERRPEWTVGLVPTAVGGSSLSGWRAGGSLFNAAVDRVRAALRDSGRLEAILWHQGESDNRPELAAAYVNRFVIFVAALRRALGAPDALVLVGELGAFTAAAKLINPRLAELPAYVPNCRIVSAAGLSDVGDGLHFDAQAARELGRRYANAIP